MKRSFLFFIGYCIIFLAQASPENRECPVGIKISNQDNGMAEITLINNSEQPVKINYDQLPWEIGAARGMIFDVYIDGRKIIQPYGLGHNDYSFIRLGAKSSISSEINIKRALGSYYIDVDKSRVKIRWAYFIPMKGLEEACRKLSGEIDPP